MISVRRTGWTALILFLFGGGAAAIVCARWTGPIAAGDAALARGDVDAARVAYAAAEARFNRTPVLETILPHAYARAIGAELAIASRRERYDEVIDRAAQAPPLAAPHFWAGLAFLAKSRGDGTLDPKIEQRSAWLMRAEEELRLAVEAAPDDWDTKYDFELVTRLAAALRKNPQMPPDQLAPLLRPEPRAGTRPPRRVG